MFCRVLAGNGAPQQARANSQARAKKQDTRHVFECFEQLRGNSASSEVEERKILENCPPAESSEGKARIDRICSKA